MNWNDIQLFALTARSSSFTHAAQGTDLSAVSLARRITALEDKLGIRLFLRGTRGVSLTPEGKALLAKAEAAATCMEAWLETASRFKTTGWSSPIRITGTEPVIADLVAPRIHLLLVAHPELKVELNVSNDVVSLSAHSAEIALRFANPRGNSLKVGKVAQFQLALFKSPDYAEPFETARFIGYDGKYGDIPEVAWMRAQGFDDRMVLRSSSTAALVQAARSGLGIALLPRAIASLYGDLEEVLYTPTVAKRNLWMMAQPDMAKVPEIRKVMDWLATALRSAATLR